MMDWQQPPKPDDQGAKKIAEIQDAKRKAVLDEILGVEQAPEVTKPPDVPAATK
jgi:hypothetical protein